MSHLSVVGQPNGDLVVVAMGAGHAIPLTNLTNDHMKVFRSPKFLISYLLNHGISRVLADLTQWDVSKVFDAHERATQLRKKNTGSESA